MSFAYSNRFVNGSIQELQQVNRNLILECNDIPLMSLEESVVTIVHHCPNVIAHAKKAKESCRQNTILTINESASIYLYTMNSPFYPALNQALRSENPQALRPWLAYLKLLITALKKLPSLVTTVWRGVAGDIGSDFDKNSIHTWWSINSCSSEVNVAAMFAEEKRTFFCINTIYGKDITKFSANQDEDEVVLMPGTCLRVQSTSSGINGLYLVHLNEW